MFKQQYENLHKNSQPKERLVTDTVNMMNEYSGKKQMKQWYFQPVTICFFVMFTVTVFATTGISEDIQRFLGIGENSQEALSSGVQVIDQYIQDESGTIHIKEALGDGSVTYLFFDFIAPEHTVLNKNYYSFVIDKSGPTGLGGHTKKLTQLEDLDKTDNKLSFVLEITTDYDMYRKKIQLNLVDLYGYDEEIHNMHGYNMFVVENNKKVLNEEYIKETYPGVFETLTVLNGDWISDEIKLKFTDMTKTHNVNNEYSFDVGKMIVKNIDLSPLSVTVYGTYNSYSESTEDLFVDIIQASNNYTFYYGDGTSETAQAYGYIDHIDKSFNFTHTFLPVLEKEIVAITIGGELIILNEEYSHLKDSIVPEPLELPQQKPVQSIETAEDETYVVPAGDTNTATHTTVAETS